MSGSLVGADKHTRTQADRLVDELPRAPRVRRRAGDRVAKRLRCDPVLAVAAMQIAPEHPEAVCQASWICVKERLFLDLGRTGHPPPPGHPQVTPVVVANFADTERPVWNGTTVSACDAPQSVRVDPLVQLSLPGEPTEGLGKG